MRMNILRRRMMMMIGICSVVLVNSAVEPTVPSQERLDRSFPLRNVATRVRDKN